MIRLSQKWLHVGALEDAKWATEEYTTASSGIAAAGQGVFAPVFDEWVEASPKEVARGDPGWRPALPLRVVPFGCAAFQQARKIDV